MGHFRQFMEQSSKTVIAFHGTKSAVQSFGPLSSFSPNVEMAKRYIKIGGSFNTPGPNRLYKVEITYSNPDTVSTQDNLRKRIMEYHTRPAFKLWIKQSKIDAFVYGIPNLDSDCVIAPISSSQVRIIDHRDFTDEDINNGSYLTWAEGR